jgi:hypothetical protein
MSMDSQSTTGAVEPAATGASEAKVKGRSKAKAKPASEAKGKRSLNLSMPYADYERLALHALAADTTISELVCRLAREHLREVHLTRTPARDAG